MQWDKQYNGDDFLDNGDDDKDELPPFAMVMTFLIMRMMTKMIRKITLASWPPIIRPPPLFPHWQLRNPSKQNWIYFNKILFYVFSCYYSNSILFFLENIVLQDFVLCFIPRVLGIFGGKLIFSYFLKVWNFS